jgi:hypothetical protein
MPWFENRREGSRITRSMRKFRDKMRLLRELRGEYGGRLRCRSCGANGRDVKPRATVSNQVLCDKCLLTVRAKHSGW